MKKVEIKSNEINITKCIKSKLVLKPGFKPFGPLGLIVCEVVIHHDMDVSLKVCYCYIIQ